MGSSLSAAAARGLRSRIKAADTDPTWISSPAEDSATADRIRTRPRRATPAGRVVTARAGDHPAVHRLLVSVLHRPNEAEFQLSTERPGYQPSERLLLLRDQDPVAHVRLAPRWLRFGTTWVPTCDLTEFACLPEYRLLGDDSALLAVAEAQAAASGAVLATVLTDQSELFTDGGWVVAGGARCLRTNPRTLLARLSRRSEPPLSRRLLHASAEPVVRPWRYVEQQALQELYRQTARCLCGAPRRDAAYWEWLLVRRGYEQILVAALPSASPASSDLLHPETIVGYAFTRGSDVVELVADSGHPHAMHKLLQRVASEAIERDAHEVRLFQPPTLTSLAAGSDADTEAAADTANAKPLPQQMIKVLNPREFLQQHAARMAHAAHAGGLSEGTRLGLQLDRDRVTLRLDAKQIHWKEGLTTRRCVRASGAGVTALLLGLQGCPDLYSEESLEVRDSDRDLAIRFFPRQPIWRSTLDDLPSMMG